MKHLGNCLLVLLFFSCTREYTSGATNFIYENDSDHRVALKSYVGGDLVFEFDLNSGEQYIEEVGDARGVGNGPRSTTRFEANDSVLTIFNDSLAMMYDGGSLDGNPMRIENYELVEGEKEPYIYLFEFTNEDYQRALDRGRIINN